MDFEDTASAAEAATEAAKKAIAAAEAAAYLAQKDQNHVSEKSGYCNNDTSGYINRKPIYGTLSGNGPPNNSQDMGDNFEVTDQAYESHSFGNSHYSGNEGDIVPPKVGSRIVNRRHSVPSARSNIQFDESDSDEEEIDAEEPTDGGTFPPCRSAPRVPHVPTHPNLPDYDALSARFEALKHRKST